MKNLCQSGFVDLVSTGVALKVSRPPRTGPSLTVVRVNACVES